MILNERFSIFQRKKGMQIILKPNLFSVTFFSKLYQNSSYHYIVWYAFFTSLKRVVNAFVR